MDSARVGLGCVSARGRNGRVVGTGGVLDLEVNDENLFFCVDNAFTALGVAGASLGEQDLGKSVASFDIVPTLAEVSTADDGVVARTKPEPDDEKGLRATNLSKDWVREPERLRDFVTDSRWDVVADVVWVGGKLVADDAGSRKDSVGSISINVDRTGCRLTSCDPRESA